MPTLPIIITDAGRAAHVNETNTATLPVTITEVALGTGRWVPDVTATALNTEIKRINTQGGLPVAPDVIHATINDSSTDTYSLGEIGFYTDTGVLFAIYSDSVSGITDKAAGAALLISADIKFTSFEAATITISGPGFVNPPATETVSGVLKLATQVLADEGLDHTSAITPQTLEGRLVNYLLANSYTADDVLAKLLTVDGSTSLLDADLLDGQHGSFYQNASNLNAGTLPALRFSDVSHGGRAGGTLHALATTLAHGFMSSTDKSKLNGIENNATADQTAAEIIALLLTVDGSLSGLDADLLDGLHAAFLRNASNLNAGTLPALRFSDVSHGARAGSTLHALATTLAHGFMSSSDKSKLDGVESNATADQTAAEILALLLTVDGATSGLDSQYLAGQLASFYQSASNLNAGTLPALRFSDVSHGARAGGTLHALSTTLAHGFMSSSDKSKLNGIEGNATADQTPAEILAALLTVDGTSSGLDADLFQGQTPAQFIANNNINTVGVVRCFLHLSLTTVIPTVSTAQVKWGFAQDDPLAMWDDVGKQRITIPAGVSKIRIHTCLIFDYNASGAREVYISKNNDVGAGSAIVGGGFAAAYGGSDVVNDIALNATSTILDVIPGDYFTVVAKSSANSDVGVLPFTGQTLNKSWVCLEVVE